MILLTLIGGILRLYNIESSLAFLGDQGRDASIVRRLITDGDIILVGPTTSVGKIQLGPLYYYFMAPWLWFFNFDPIGPAIGVALVGTITIPLLFFVTRSMFGTTASLITTSLYTFGAVIIFHTRSSWNPNPMPIVIILMLWAFYQAYQNKRYRYITLAWVAYAIALQLHYMVLVLAPFFAIMHLLIIYSIQENNEPNTPSPSSRFQGLRSPQAVQIYQSIAMGIAAFIIFAIPLIVFDFRHNYLNLNGFLEFFDKGHHTSSNIWESVKGVEGRMFQSIGMPLGTEPNYTLRNTGSWILMVAFFGYSLRHWKNKAIQIIALFITVSTIGLSVYSGDVFEHYIAYVFPIPFIMVGIICASLIKTKNIALQGFAILIVIGLLVLNVSRYPQKYPTFGWQLDDIEATSQKIAQDIGPTTAYNISLLDDTHDYRAMNYRYFAELSNTNLLPQDSYQDAQVLYLITTRPEFDLETINVWEIQSFPGKTITKQWELDTNLWMYKIEKP